MSLVVLLGAVLATLLAPTASQATVTGKGPVAESFSDDYEECGIPVHEESVVTGTGLLRVGKGKTESAFFSHENLNSTNTITNPATGRYFTVVGKVLFHEVTGTRIEGSIFRFTAITAGTSVLRNDSGQVVTRDGGVDRITILFDTLGDDTPGGVFVDFVSEYVRGHHPGLHMTEDEWCAQFHELLD